MATGDQSGGAVTDQAEGAVRRYSITGRSSLRPFTEPSMIYMRIRSIFGLSARSEILRSLLFTRERSTAATLAARTNYTKRNVAEACDSLVQAGILRSRQVGNRLYFSIADEDALSTFLGPSAHIHPDWPALLRVLSEIYRWAFSAAQSDDRVLVVETHRVFKQIQPDLESLGSEPDHVTGARFLPIWRRWSVAFTESVATGKWPAIGGASAARSAMSRTGSPGRKVG
jgi:hypothetical protein